MKPFLKTDGGRKSAFPNSDRRAGDCVIRAITIATGKPYKQIWKELFSIALETGNFPNADSVCVTYLESEGWERVKFGKKLVRMNSHKIPKDKTIICHTRGHWVAMMNGIVNDTWDSTTNSMEKSNRVFSYYIKEKV